MPAHTFRRAMNSIHFKYFLGIEITALLSSILLGLVLINSHFRSTLDTTLETAGTYAQRLSSILEAETQTLRAQMDYITMDDQVWEVLSRDNGGRYADIQDWLQDHILVADRIRQGCFNSEIKSVYVLTDNSFADEYYSQQILSLERMRQTSWYSQVSQSKGSFLFHTPEDFAGTTLYFPDSIYLTRNLPIQYSAYETYFVGVIDHSVLMQILEEDRMPFCSCAILNEHGNSLTQLPEDLRGLFAGIQQKLYSTRDFRLQSIQASGKQYYAVKTGIYNTDLTLVYLVDYNQMYMDLLANYGRTIALLALAMLPFSLLVSYFVSRSLTRRIGALKDRMLQAQTGDFRAVPSPAEDSGGDEVEVLSQTFQGMLSRISGLMEEQYVSGQRIKELELVSLQAQINPHFLYNTLDLIKWRALRSGDKETEELVSALSSYYRLGLSRGKEMVPLRSELDHIRYYVFIQNKRFDDAVTLDIRVPEEYLDVLVPKLLLQPIVENAILHGILELPEPVGNIWVTAAPEEGCLCLTIRDNGVGIQSQADDPDQAEKVPVIRTGYGLRNIEDRIRLAFGQNYGLDMRPATGGGTVVTLRLPLPPEENESGKEKC